MLKRIWESPTVMTWMSYSTKALTLFGVLPLVLKRFSPGEVVLWYLVTTIINMQNLADFGFRQTFTRIISYAFSGAKHIGVFKNVKDGNQTATTDAEPNTELLTAIVSTMKHIYLRLTGIIFILMAIFGTMAMVKPVHDAADTKQSWISWVVVLIISCISFYGKLYMNFLEGLYKIALVRRIETLTSLGSILTSIIVLIASPTLLNLVFANQFWVLIVTLRDWYLCRKIDNGFYKAVSAKRPFDKQIFKQIWPSAWRSGISGLMSIGLTNVTGLVYAQFGATGPVAAYLLALRIISQVRDISMAPFYSKLPLFAILRAKNATAELFKVVKRAMILSHLVYITGFVLIGVFSTELLKLLKTDIHFVDAQMWALLGFAFFVHRFGAMHIQVYLSTNHIISHIADGVSGILYIASALLLSPHIGIYAVPVAMLIGYLGFYAWYSAVYSYRSINTTFFKFERSTLPIPLIILILYFLVEYYQIYH